MKDESVCFHEIKFQKLIKKGVNDQMPMEEIYEDNGNPLTLGRTNHESNGNDGDESDHEDLGNFNHFDGESDGEENSTEENDEEYD